MASNNSVNNHMGTVGYPSTAQTAGKVLQSNGTDFVGSTPTYPTTAGTVNNVLTSDGTNWVSQAPTGGGNVSGPVSSTDRAIATWNGTGGTLLRDNSTVSITAAGDILSSRSDSGNFNRMTIQNSSNTASSSSQLVLQTGGSSSGDASVYNTTGSGADFVVGKKNSTNSYNMATNGDLSTGLFFSASSAGHIIMPSQPAFSYSVNSAVTNVTGDGTLYTLVFSNQNFQKGGNNWDGTSTFTCPNDSGGVYHFNLAIILQNLTTSHNTCQLILSVSGVQNYTFNVCNPGAMKDVANNLSVGMNSYILLGPGDTLQAQLTVSGGTKTVGISNAAINSWIQGTLVC